METNYTKPIKTLHGTQPEALHYDYYNAMQAVREAEIAMLGIEFHARDYAGLYQFQMAKQERNAMFEKLQQIYLYLEDIAASIQY